MLLLGAAALPASLFSQEICDSTDITMPREMNLEEVAVVARRPVLKQNPDRITYLVKNDPYAPGLDAMQLLERVPRISVINDLVSVAGKNSVRYIVDGHLLEMPQDAITMKLKNLQADGIEKIELLTSPPAKYGIGDNVAYISITTRNESLGYRGNLWSRGSLSDHFNYSLGGNICNTTRKVELSADISWNDYKGKNDFYSRYVFDDHSRISDRTNSFDWHTLGANGLVKYKFDSRWSAGAIVNFSSNRMSSRLRDTTTDNGSTMLSSAVVPSYPDNALTLTGFIDWNIAPDGKTLSLTYNRFDKRSASLSDVTTEWDYATKSRLLKDADNRYGIHSVKLDATLPFSSFRMETGAAYTSIGNDTDLKVSDEVNGNPVDNPAQSNHFIYNEKTVALYLGAERNFSRSFFGKAILRYEHTDVRGRQQADNSFHNRSYQYLFPSVNLGMNLYGAGKLSADYSMGISRPIFGDMNPFRYYNTVNDYFTGNPDLRPAVSHNAGINYSFNGLYAVVYGSWSHNAIGYITRFSPDGMKWTIPENCLNTVKTGIYASYNRSLFDWWNINIGGEVFYSASKSLSPEYLDSNCGSWSGKLDMNSSWMLNSRKSLILSLRCSTFFPYTDRMVRYGSHTLLYCELRYLLLDSRLVITASVNDPFGWNVTGSKTFFANYTLHSRNDVHSHSAALRISWSFGRNKVNNVYRDSKERESSRAN